MSLRVQGPDGCVHVQPIPLIAVALRPVGNTSVTVTAPEVDPVPELPTVRIYVATVWPCVKLPLCVLLIVKLGAPVTGKSQMPELPPPAGFCTITWAIPATAISDAAMAACSCVPLTYVVVRLVPFQYTTEPLTNPFPFTVRVKAPVPAMSDAVMAACSCVPLPYVVVRLVPFQYTTEPFINPFPFTVRVKAPVPAVADEGDNEVSDGAGLGGALMVKPVLVEVPPPGAGLNTITWTVPAEAISAALMDTSNCVPLTKVAVRFAPFQFTTDPLTNPLPFTVRVKAAVPPVADEGDRKVIAGTGLLPGEFTVKPALLEVPPPGDGLNTVTWAVPAEAMSAALMAAWSCPPFTYVVDRFAPFQFTTDPLINPLPFTVSVKAAVPAVAKAGDNEVIDGTGLGACHPRTVMLPPVAGIDAPVPSASACTAFATEIVTEGPLVAAASVTLTCATTPLLIVVEFTPNARHINDPFPGLHEIDLPALVSAVPATTLREATLPATEGETVHCKPAGWTAPFGTVKFKFRIPFRLAP